MSKADILAALANNNAMAEYLKVRNDSEVVADVRSVMNPEPTLRDQFAMAILTGAMVNATNLGVMTVADRWSHFINTAAIIYEMADAMIEVREAANG